MSEREDQPGQDAEAEEPVDEPEPEEPDAEPEPAESVAEPEPDADPEDPAPGDDPDGDPGPTRFVTSQEQTREEGITTASRAVQRGQLVVLPTDTVYGVGVDAFDPDAVRRLLAAKGRGREMPPPVLISAATTLDALAVGVPAYARTLIDTLWPGPLTLVCRQQPSLQWDLGDTRGTVAVRMPDHPVALELLSRTGPMAVSSANTSGRPAAQNADDAERMLGSSVAVILDAGPSTSWQPSTIVDVTDSPGRLLREGAVSLERLNEIVSPLGVEIVDAG